MQAIEPNATKLWAIWESTRFWQRSLTGGGVERVPSKTHVLLLKCKEKKFRQVRRRPLLYRQKLMINLNEIRMKNYFNSNEGKRRKKQRNTKNSKIIKNCSKKFRHFHFRVYRRLKKRLTSKTKALILKKILKELKS